MKTIVIFNDKNVIAESLMLLSKAAKYIKSAKMSCYLWYF